MKQTNWKKRFDEKFPEKFYGLSATRVELKQFIEEEIKKAEERQVKSLIKHLKTTKCGDNPSKDLEIGWNRAMDTVVYILEYEIDEKRGVSPVTLLAGLQGNREAMLEVVKSLKE